MGAERTTAAPEAASAEAGKALQGPGAPLDAAAAERLRPSFGQQVDKVRVHTDAATAEFARERHLRAFALGNHIGFADGRYQPQTPQGLALLAHELAHTGQQAGGSGGGRADTEAAEHDADAGAAAALVGLPAEPRVRTGLGLQGCIEESPAPMNREQLLEYLTRYRFNLVFLEDTTQVLQGMSKRVAIAVSEHATPRSESLTRQPIDQLLTYRLDYPRLRSVTVTYPSPNAPRASTPNSATGAFVVHFLFAGPTTVRAVADLTPGYPVTIERTYDVGAPDFARASEAAVPADLAFRGQSQRQALLSAFGRTAELRRQAVTAGHLDRAVDDAYAAFLVAAVQRIATLQGGGAQATPGALDPLREALNTALLAQAEGGYRGLVQTNASSVAYLAGLTDATRLQSALRSLHDSYLGWVHGVVDRRGGSAELKQQLTHARGTERELAALERRSTTPPVQLPGVFHAELHYLRRQLMPAPMANTGRIVPLPLSLWVYGTGPGRWELRDLTAPDNVFTYTTNASDSGTAIQDLLRQLREDTSHWTQGRLYVHVPGDRRYSWVVGGGLSVSQWLGLFAVALAAAGFIALTAGAGTPIVASAGGAALTLSAGLGAAAIVADTVEAANRGQLTAGRVVLNVVQFVATVATAGTATLVTRAAAGGRTAMAALGANARYVVLNRVAAGADILTIALMSGEAAAQLARIHRSNSSDKAFHATMVITQLLAMGALTFVSARDAFGGSGLRGHPGVELREGPDGVLLLVRPGAEPVALPRGAVLGSDVYPLTNTRQVADATVGALSPSHMNAELDRMARSARTHGAQLTMTAPDAGRLTVTAHDGSVHTVDLQFARRDALPAATTHVPPGGGPSLAGPARVDLIPPGNAGGNWTAKITVDGRLQRTDVRPVVGHELDEIASIVRTHPNATPADIAREMEAGVFRQGIDPAHPPAITAHDRASAAELFEKFANYARLQEELRLLRGTPRPNDQLQGRLAALPRLIRAEQGSLERLATRMGLMDGVNVEPRNDLLRTVAVERRTSLPPTVTARSILDEWEEVIQVLRTIRGADLLAAHGTPFGPRGRGITSTFTNETVAHIAFPEPHAPVPGTEPGNFKERGIRGGHDDAALLAFVANHPEYGYALRLEATRTVDGVTYNNYSQWMWAGAGTPPRPGTVGHPATVGAAHAGGWRRSDMPKTTVSDLRAFLVDAERALYAWVRHPTRQARFGPGGAAAQHIPFTQQRPGGVRISGYFDFTPPGTFRMRTAFVEASWF